jgi:SNF2 family DNA or RNA helicase
MKEITEYEQFFNDNPRLTKLICYHAYCIERVDNDGQQAYARAEKTTLKEVQALAKRCHELGYLRIDGYDWCYSRSTYSIEPKHYLPCLIFMFSHEDWGWEDTFKKASSRIIKESPKLNRLVYNALKGKTTRLKLADEEQLDYADLLAPLYRYPQIFSVADRLMDITMVLMVNYALIDLIADNQFDEADGLTALIDRWESSHETMINMGNLRDLVRLYRYFANGEYQPLPKEVDFEALASSPKTLSKQITSNRLLLETIRFAYQGQYELAAKLYESFFKLTNPGREIKNAFTSTICAYVHVMTLIHEGSEASMKRVAKYVNDRKMMDHFAVYSTCLLATYFTDSNHRMSQNGIDALWRRTPIDKQLANLLTHYAQLAPSVYATADLPLPRFAILRHEMSSFLPLDDAERARLKEAFGENRLLYSIRFKAQWEYTLEDLLSARQTEVQSKSNNQTSRLMYAINYGTVEPREQYRLKSGEWSAGKVISSQRYASGQLEFMNEADQRIWNQFRRSGNYHLTPEIVLPELVGDDRLYTGYHAPYTPVKLTSEKPYLTIEKGREYFNVHASYQPGKDGKVYESPTHIVTQLSETEYVVTPISGMQRRFFDGLLHIGRFPIEAEAKLKEFFPKVSEVIEVHSTTFAEGNTLETVPGDLTLYLQASPREDCFHLQIIVRPLPGGKATFVPGQGPVLIPDETEGRRVQVQRPLKEEKRRMKALTELLEKLTDGEIHSGEMTLSTEDMLNVVEQLRALSDRYVIEWEEGKKLNLKKTAKTDKWDISLNRHGGWFELEGEINLDDDTVLSMAQLLELVGHSRGEYVRLNDQDYLQLSENLRRQLSRLEAVAVHQRGKVEIPALTAGLLGNDALDGEFTVKADETLQQLRDRIGESRALTPKVPAKLQATLRDYQEDGFRWIARLNHWGTGACLADDMGLGKTVQTIAYLLYIAKDGASLVVAPASVVPNWKRELARFAPSLHVSMLNESSDRAATIREASARHIVVSTYGLLVSESEALTQKQWNAVCLDEAHTIKNRETKTSAVAMQMQADHRLILTGTPVQNHLGELWNLFQFINPGLLGSYEQFQQKYILPIEGEHDKLRQQQLNRLVHPFMLRRTKREVVEELPDKEEIILPVELSDNELSIYEVIRRKAKEMVAEGGAKVNVATLAQITKLRQAACCAELVEEHWKGGCSKIDRLIDLMNELRENGHRALVFSQFTSFFALIRPALEKAGIEYLYLDGSVPVRRRQQLVDEFQEGDCPFFLISLKAGGLGLNLTGANYIIHLDPWWNPAIEQQATDRAYRIGQKQKVTAYHLVSAHTIEEKILRLHASKRDLSDALLAGTDMSHKISAKDLMDILDTAQEDDE